MQLSDRVLSDRYARALYLSAAERGEEQRVNSELSKVYRLLIDKMPVLKHPRVSVSEKKALLGKLLGGSISPTIIRFLELLIDKKRFSLLPNLAADFSSIYDERHGVVNALVKSAAELSSREKEVLKTRLDRFTGKKVNLEVKVVPELLAGVTVRMGDWILDGSLKGKLQRMRRELAGA